MKRIIGEYTGDVRGPLLIVVGGIHGNEPAGVKALDLLFKMLEVEPIRNPSFQFKGKIIGLRGNLKALESKCRFIDKDLNRLWTKENVQKILSRPLSSLESEELELRMLYDEITKSAKAYAPEQIYFLDLHTTTAFGGIFTIPTNDEDSIKIALSLYAPVIKGFLLGIKGTTLHFFNEELFNVPTTALSFESGQHDEPLSVNRAIAALVNLLRSIGSVSINDVESQHDNILKEYSKGLPSIARLIQAHKIEKGSEFKMMPGYKNFQPVSKNQVIATSKNGDISVEKDGYLLMPLYQDKGEDGFFVIEEIEGY